MIQKFIINRIKKSHKGMLLVARTFYLSVRILEILATDLAIMLQVGCKFNLKISRFLLCPPVLHTTERHLYSPHNGSAHLYEVRVKALVFGLCCVREELAEAP